MKGVENGTTWLGNEVADSILVSLIIHLSLHMTYDRFFRPICRTSIFLERSPAWHMAAKVHQHRWDVLMPDSKRFKNLLDSLFLAKIEPIGDQKRDIDSLCVSSRKATRNNNDNDSTVLQETVELNTLALTAICSRKVTFPIL